MQSSLTSLELQFALDALINKIPRTVTRDDGSTVQIWDDSLIDQLAELGQGGEVGQGGAHAKPGSKPPISIDVLALRLEMRKLHAQTPAQLRAIVDNDIRAQRWASCERWTVRLRQWAQRIRDMSGAVRARSRPLPIPCPLCGGRWQIADVDGETVRRPIMSALFDDGLVLSIDCASCGSWPRGPVLDELVAHMMAA